VRKLCAQDRIQPSHTEHHRHAPLPVTCTNGVPPITTESDRSHR
jgi:hypothetical protein